MREKGGLLRGGGKRGNKGGLIRGRKRGGIKGCKSEIGEKLKIGAIVRMLV